MGIDYYSCDYCGKSFPDCCNYEYCNCGKHWCSEHCAELAGLEVNRELEECDDFSEEMNGYKTCQYCRKEDVEDYNLVDFLLNKLEITREEAVKEYYSE